MFPTHSSPGQLACAALLEKVSKYYGRTVALRSISAQFLRGETSVIFGANGAGKSSLLRTLAGLILPDEGKSLVNGINTASDRVHARREVGVTLHYPMLYNDLTVRENLTFAGRLMRVNRLPERCEEVITQVKLAHKMDERVRWLSRGMVQRVTIAKSLLAHPFLLIMDEPETGLDAEAVDILESILDDQRRRRGAAIVATHDVEWGLRCSDSAVVLRKGRLAWSGSSSSITASLVTQLASGADRGANRSDGQPVVALEQ